MTDQEHNDELPHCSPRAITAKPGRFSLLELFVFTALICVFAAAYTWSGYASRFSEVVMGLTAIGLIGFSIHMITRWSLTAWLAGILAALFLGALMLPSLNHGPEPSRRMQCSNHLKQIGLALQNYHDTFGCFPPAYIADKQGRPMHSWRVLILPFIEHKPLYDKYRFHEPWDGPNNSKLHNEIVEVFCCPSRPKQQTKTETSYVAVIGPQTAWPGEKTTKLSDFKDGTSNTLLVVELANSGIHWLEPRDLHVLQMPMAVNPERGQGISSPHRDCALAVYADGHTQQITKNTPPEILRALLTIGGGETIGDY